MTYEEFKNLKLVGERAAYGSRNSSFVNCTFEDGESPLKESKNIKVNNCVFAWKYPLWYCENVEVINTKWLEMGRSGVWYTKNILIKDSMIDSPKQFRRCKNVTITNSNMPLAQETLWHCENVTLDNSIITGDYFGMNCNNVTLNNVTINGNYCFDGAKNITACNCIFNSKDAFWNCKNVVIKDSTIIGEFLAWNTKNITFINCKIESHQGLCYIDELTLKNCEINNSDLCFELCSNINAEINSIIDSVKNPISGIIRCESINELILDPKIIDKSKTTIEVRKHE